jgi:hypothetical protein
MLTDDFSLKPVHWIVLVNLFEGYYGIVAVLPAVTPISGVSNVYPHSIQPVIITRADKHGWWSLDVIDSSNKNMALLVAAHRATLVEKLVSSDCLHPI